MLHIALVDRRRWREEFEEADYSRIYSNKLTFQRWITEWLTGMQKLFRFIICKSLNAFEDVLK